MTEIWPWIQVIAIVGIVLWIFGFAIYELVKVIRGKF